MFVLSAENSIANHFIAELRNKDIQQDRHRFRTNLKRLGQLIAYEISKKLEYGSKSIQTPLADMDIQVVKDEIVLISIMRAALPFHEGFLDMFNQADAGFIGAWRKESEGDEIEVSLEYMAAPDLNGKTLILVDPMLATGKSLIKCLNQLMKHGQPRQLHIASVIAAPEGIELVNNSIEQPFELWVGAVDDHLNEQSYIVPGLGDAGDLSFGSKL